jgi:methylphosphotriester-DNA--protein-cysteine methyltransferase
MTFKKLIPFFVFLFLLSSVKLKAQTVYITDSGKKYHAKNCSMVKTGKKGLDLAEAKKQGYEPCKYCKADAIEPKKATKPAPKNEVIDDKKKS